jgi:RHS repeat-associated protein
VRRRQASVRHRSDRGARITPQSIDFLAAITSHPYQYDGLGNRVAQTVNGASTHYLLDLLAPLLEVIAATQGASSTRYVQVGGQVLAQREANAWQYVLPDHLGSLRQLTTGTGEITLQQSYRPFGEQLERTGTGSSLFGFTGEPADVTGLVHLRARYYSPAQGRFLAPDPLAGWQTVPYSLHPYQYGYSNPLKYLDPSGHVPVIPILIAGGIAFAVWLAHPAPVNAPAPSDPTVARTNFGDLAFLETSPVYGRHK